MLCPKNSDLMSLMILVGFSCDLTHWLICIGWRSWSRTSSWTDSIFLPHDAMHKRGLCRRTVSVCPSAYLSVRPSRSCILLKRVNIFSKFFTVGYPQYSIYFFVYQMLWQYSYSDLKFGQNRDFRPIFDFRIDDWCSVEYRQQFGLCGKVTAPSVGLR